MNRSHLPILFYLVCASNTVGCNSRPTYNIEVYEFTSNCDSITFLKVEHDPEPEVQSLNIEPDFESEAVAKGIYFKREENTLRVFFGSGIKCESNLFGSDDMVCYLPHSTELANCKSSLSLYSWRYPSRGPGYQLPYAKYPGDEVLQSAIEQPNYEYTERDQ